MTGDRVSFDTTRQGDRRGVPQRADDRAAHYLREAVLSAAVAWREADHTDPDTHVEASRRLAEAVDGWTTWDNERGSGAINALLVITVVVVALTPTRWLGVGTWGRWFAAMGALSALAVYLWRTEHEDSE